MKHDEPVETGHRRSSHVNLWYIVGGAVLMLAATGVLTSLHDIRRYMKIRSM